MLKEYLDLSNLFWTGWNTCISMLFPLHKQSENPWVRYYLSKTWSCSRIYSMLVFGSCFLGPRQLVVRKVNVLYYTLHSKRNLKCQKWPAVINWTWVLTFRRCLYRIWLHFKILATLQFLFKIRTTRRWSIMPNLLVQWTVRKQKQHIHLSLKSKSEKKIWKKSKMWPRLNKSPKKRGK